jgi:hypothetical protein
VIPCALPVPTHLRPVTRGFRLAKWKAEQEQCLLATWKLFISVDPVSILVIYCASSGASFIAVSSAVSRTTLMSKSNSFVKMLGVKEHTRYNMLAPPHLILHDDDDNGCPFRSAGDCACNHTGTTTGAALQVPQPSRNKRLSGTHFLSSQCLHPLSSVNTLCDTMDNSPPVKIPRIDLERVLARFLKRHLCYLCPDLSYGCYQTRHRADIERIDADKR